MNLYDLNEMVRIKAERDDLLRENERIILKHIERERVLCGLLEECLIVMRPGYSELEQRTREALEEK